MSLKIIFCHSVSEFFEAHHNYPRNIIVLKRNVLSKSDLLKIARIIGRPYIHGAFEAVREIKISPSTGKFLALSSAAHPPHIDGTFAEQTPSNFLLSFAQADVDGGGTSHFWSISELLEACPYDYVVALQTGIVEYSRVSEKGGADIWNGSILSTDRTGQLILRWRNDEFVYPKVLDDKGLPLSKAIDWLKAYFKENSPYEYQGETGDTIRIPQAAYLHGRSELSSDVSERLVYRLWMY